MQIQSLILRPKPTDLLPSNLAVLYFPPRRVLTLSYLHTHLLRRCSIVYQSLLVTILFKTVHQKTGAAVPAVRLGTQWPTSVAGKFCFE
ncbi:hypothetical protein DTO212C5_4747 [Paecilomyces variotii]|nr:hypothetical protein DTO212C5_4747 [Paecilomyces variotii]